MMSYQTIQDYADMLADARLGYADFNEVMHDIYIAKPSTAEYAAIRRLADAYCISAMGDDVDWERIESEIKEILK